MLRVKDDLLDMTDELTVIYEGTPFTGVSFDCGNEGRVTSEILYQNGVQEGLSKDWYEMGEIRSEGEYRNGTLHGWQREWFCGGQLRSESLFEFGVRTKHKEWDEDGNVLENFEIGENDPNFIILKKFKKLKNISE